MSKSDFVAFRAAAHTHFSPRSVESTVNTVRLLLRFAEDDGIIASVPHVGRRLRCIVRVKYVPPVEHLGKLYTVCGISRWRSQSWWRRFLVFGYTTGLRLSDLLSLTEANIGDDCISIVAEKTGKHQVLPLLPCAKRHLPNLLKPVTEGRILPCSKSIELVRRDLTLFCRVADVPRITPHAIRRCSANAYEAARPGAGALLLGHSLEGATQHYIHVPQLLKDAAARLQIPAEFEGPQH